MTQVRRKATSSIPLTVTRMGPRQYRVSGHHVDLAASDAAGRCTCADYVYRRESKGEDCKHLAAARRLDQTDVQAKV